MFHIAGFRGIDVHFDRRKRSALLMLPVLYLPILAGYRIYRSYSDALARKTFRYSIVYLAALFASLLVDHYL